MTSIKTKNFVLFYNNLIQKVLYEKIYEYFNVPYTLKLIKKHINAKYNDHRTKILMELIGWIIYTKFRYMKDFYKQCQYVNEFANLIVELTNEYVDISGFSSVLNVVKELFLTFSGTTMEVNEIIQMYKFEREKIYNMYSVSRNYYIKWTNLYDMIKIDVEIYKKSNVIYNNIKEKEKKEQKELSTLDATKKLYEEYIDPITNLFFQNYLEERKNKTKYQNLEIKFQSIVKIIIDLCKLIYINELLKGEQEPQQEDIKLIRENVKFKIYPQQLTIKSELLDVTKLIIDPKELKFQSYRYLYAFLNTQLGGFSLAWDDDKSVSKFYIYIFFFLYFFIFLNYRQKDLKFYQHLDSKHLEE